MLGNYLGTDVNGTGALGNAFGGVFILFNSSNNIIGGASAGAGNVIAYNAGRGVLVSDVGINVNNQILGNAIFSNNGLGIDLQNDGVSANDAGDTDGGANNRQNFQVLSSATASPTQITITGSLNSTANTNFTVEYFMNELRYSGSTAVIEIDLSSGDPVKINVVNKLQLGKEAEVRLLPNGESDSKLVTFNTKQSSSVSFGKEAYLLGSFNAPNANLTLVKNSQLRGSICVNELLVERDCLFLHHDSPGSLPGPGNLPKSSEVEESEAASDQSPVISYQLEQNYPNPFNPSTTISFALPEAGEASLSIYNINGQLVKKLVAGEMNAGHHSVIWDARDAHSQQVASGVYVYVLKAGGFTAQRKLVLMK